MKTLRFFSTTALALVMAACSSDDNDYHQPLQKQGTMHFTATIAAPNSGTVTRTEYTEDGTSINVAWKVGDQIALLYDGGKDVAEVTAIDGSGNATIEATINLTPENGQAVTLAYPAAALNDAGSMDDTYLAKVQTQDGTLNYIQDYLDFREGSGKFVVNGANVSLQTNVTLDSQIAIWKLTLHDGAAPPNALAATAVTAKVANNTVAAAASTAKSAYYLCLLPATMGSGKLTLKATVGSSTYSFTKTDGVTLTAGKFYQSTVTMAKEVPSFTINASGTKVLFAPGNLQATWNGSAWTWSFAANQWDYIGNSPGNTMVTDSSPYISGNATVDLFCWSTTTSPYGIRKSIVSYVYSGTFQDWGATISDGYSWRTLTDITDADGEWYYLLCTRESGSTVNGTSNARYTLATINTDGTGVKGLILFPDGVTIASSEATSWGAINDYSAYATMCTTAQWTAFAAKGCVFLPAAGHREGSTVWSAGEEGFYWSSWTSSTTKAQAYSVKFSTSTYDHALHPAYNTTSTVYGCSVRLIRVVE